VAINGREQRTERIKKNKREIRHGENKEKSKRKVM
jgi:hypothetical protein